MSALTAFLSDHLGKVLLLAFVLFGVVSWRWGVRFRRALRQTPRRRGALAGIALCLVVALAGFVLVGRGLMKLGPGLWQQGRMIGEPAPALAFTRLPDGGTATLEGQRGKVVLLNFWATWCPPCREEMPDLDRLQQAYGGQGLVVLQISDEDGETIRRYLEQHPMSTLHGRVDELPWPAPGRPTSFVVDRDGKVRRSFVGGRTYLQFEREIKPYL
ncbi:MAG TPA: redoxin domain-containing protein [Thermoanaerobaculia bacterium]|nr:redoxin domain-containing protein [Thermoanaerobaculia bacterium]